MLSSHLLDEVERTCDAVAIVDHGRVIRQGPIEELVRGADTGTSTSVVRVDCSAPAQAARIVERAGIAAGTAVTEDGLTVTLAAGSSRTSREMVAEINRRLVAGDISVYGLQEVRTTLEDWFLSVTSRLGEPSEITQPNGGRS
jgi:ABC-2 type transport system ATP-binding protein